MFSYVSLNIHFIGIPFHLKEGPATSKKSEETMRGMYRYIRYISDKVSQLNMFEHLTSEVNIYCSSGLQSFSTF